MTLPDKIYYAKTLADSNMLPGQYRRQPANILWAIEYGETLKITAMAAILGIHVIDGKPSASAALISGLVRSAGHRLRVTGNAERAVAQIIRSDDPEFTFEVEWTIEDARRAELLDKSGWKKYPASMLKARAISQVARDACEDVLFGLHYTPEELGADVDADGNVISLPQPAAPAAQQPDPWARPASGEDDPWVVDASGEPMINRAQMNALAELFGQLGITERPARLALASQVIEAPLASAEDLTSTQADAVIAHLKAMAEPAGQAPEADEAATVIEDGTEGDEEPSGLAVIPALAQVSLEPPRSRPGVEDYFESLATAKHLEAVGRVEERIVKDFNATAVNATMFVDLAIAAAVRREELGEPPVVNAAAAALATILTRAAGRARGVEDVGRIHALIHHHAATGALPESAAAELMEQCRQVYQASATGTDLSDAA